MHKIAQTVTTVLLAGAATALLGCASKPVAKLQVDPSLLAQLSSPVLRAAEEAHQTALADIERDLGNIKERLTRADAAVHATATDTTTDRHVAAAKLERARADLAWQTAALEKITWRRAVVDSTFEQAKATVIARTGKNIDIDAYRQQSVRLNAGLFAAERAQLAARTRLEKAERALNETKSQLAQASIASSQ